MLTRFTHHQVLGYRFKVIVTAGQLEPSTYNLEPKQSEGLA